MAVFLETLSDRPLSARRIELVERKGIGHPDTICDSVVEAVSLALNRLYLDRTGALAHYNIDKALLAAGQCEKGFGHGEITRPMELIIGDRATFVVDGTALPVAETVRAAVDAWVQDHLPNVRPARDLQVRLALAPGSTELCRIYKEQTAIGSNDTCGACGYAPLSPTEELVLAVEKFLNGPEFKGAFPDTGQDVKVMAARHDEHLTLTVAMPLLCRATLSERDYFRRKEEVLVRLAQQFPDGPFRIDWGLNCLDRPGLGMGGVYLTLSGTSAEDADSGQVGRGNRVNGLIAFSRPTGGEAAAGKNPLAHSGKIYSVLSHRLARLIHEGCPVAEEVYVHLAVRIGEPINQPWTGVQLVLPAGVELGDVQGKVRDVVEAELARFPQFQAELVRGSYAIC
ncbi:MAG: methionine adenosyltransferase [Deltaproteobacteria bacterium]|nr:methionine adenosyltransferase [Deltaproteobacteria bacterium]